MEEGTHFGEHLMIDGYGGDPQLLNDRNVVEQALLELPQQLGMSVLGGPYIEYCAGNDSKDPGGWSGLLMINESHISIHTFVGTRFVTIDVYTCKNGMDIELIKEYFTARFSLDSLECNFVKRGLQYHKHLETYHG